MANPQPDQFTKISTELLEALCRAPFIPANIRCLLFIMRRTWGYNKTWARLRNYEFVEATGIRRRNLPRYLNQLSEAKMIVATSDDKLGKNYRIQKDYELWREPKPLGKLSSDMMSNVIRCDNKLSSDVMTTPIIDNKDNLKIDPPPSADPPPPLPGEEKKPTPKPKKIKTGWPEDFELRNGMREYAVAQGYDPEKVEELFETWRLQCIAKGYTYKDWVAAYQNMCRSDWSAHKKYKATEKKVYPWQKGIWS